MQTDDTTQTAEEQTMAQEQKDRLELLRQHWNDNPLIHLKTEVEHSIPGYKCEIHPTIEDVEQWNGCVKGSYEGFYMDVSKTVHGECEGSDSTAFVRIRVVSQYTPSGSTAMFFRVGDYPRAMKKFSLVIKHLGGALANNVAYAKRRVQEMDATFRFDEAVSTLDGFTKARYGGCNYHSEGIVPKASESIGRTGSRVSYTLQLRDADIDTIRRVRGALRWLSGE